MSDDREDRSKEGENSMTTAQPAMTKPVKKTLGDKLRELREAQGLSQQEIAKRLGTSRGAYGHWERGFREPSLEDLKKIADYYDVCVDWLLGHSDLKNIHEAVDYLIMRMKQEGLISEDGKIDTDTVDTFFQKYKLVRLMAKELDF